MMTGRMFDSLNRKGFIDEIATETYGENVRYVNNTTVSLSVLPDEEFGYTWLVTERVWGSETNVVAETEDKIQAEDSYRKLMDWTRDHYAGHAAADPMNHMS
jgi:hypothetical protein